MTNLVELEGDEEVLKDEGEALQGDGKFVNCNEEALKGDSDA